MVAAQHSAVVEGPWVGDVAGRSCETRNRQDYELLVDEIQNLPCIPTLRYIFSFYFFYINGQAMYFNPI